MTTTKRALEQWYELKLARAQWWKRRGAEAVIVGRILGLVALAFAVCLGLADLTNGIVDKLDQHKAEHAQVKKVLADHAADIQGLRAMAGELMVKYGELKTRLDTPRPTPAPNPVLPYSAYPTNHFECPIQWFTNNTWLTNIYVGTNSLILTQGLYTLEATNIFCP